MRKFIIFILILLVTICLAESPKLFADTTLNIPASVTVPPHTSDYQFSFSPTDGRTSVPQNTTLSYQITYGARSSGNLPSAITLIADWSAAKAPDNTQILDYVVGSATNAYNNTSPVIDLVNHTITWSISSLPAGATDQEVTFQLKTNSNYTDPSTVAFAISAKMSNQYLSLPDQTAHQSYTFDQSIVTPTPTPTSMPTATPITNPTSTAITDNSQSATPIPISATPTPSILVTPPALIPITIDSISINEISQDSGKIGISTSIPTRITINYGLSPNNLNQSITSATYSVYSVISLPTLSSNTAYFFQTTATAISGQQVRSDIFTFKTAIPSQPPTITKSFIVISSGDTVVTTNSLSEQNTSIPYSFVIGNDAYEINFSFPHTTALRQIELLVRNSHVLSSSTTENVNGDITRNIMIEKQSGLFFAIIKTPDTPDDYDIYAHISDINGNIIEEKIAQLRVMSPIMVYELGSSQPIQNARVYFYYYDEQGKRYEPLTQAFGIKNPLFSNTKGAISANLPEGHYKIDISALSYEGVIKTFTIGEKKGEVFPKIYLRKNISNIFSIVQYYINILGDFIISILVLSQGLASAVRFFNLIAVFLVIVLIYISFLLFVFKTHIPMRHLPSYFTHQMYILFNHKQSSYTYGIVTSQDNMPLSNAFVYSVDTVSKAIIAKTLTNRNGRFYIKNNVSEKIIQLHILKEGYEVFDCNINTMDEILNGGRHIILEKGVAPKSTLWHLLIAIITDSLGVIFEGALLLSFIFELLFLSIFGVTKTLPFLFLSLFNLILWVLYIRESLHSK